MEMNPQKIASQSPIALFFKKMKLRQFKWRGCQCNKWLVKLGL